MIPNIARVLNSIVGNATILDNAKGAGRVFELFVMSSLARGLRQDQFTVWLQRSDGSIIKAADADRRFIQRGGAPAGVEPAAAGANNPSVIGFRWQRRPAWEIWNGVQFFGRSGALHEIDIAIVPASVGDALRATATGGRPTGRPRVAIECKDVGTNGSIDEMRAFIARLYDVTLLRAHHNYLPFPAPRAIHPGSPDAPKHGATVTYRQENWRTKNIIARRTGFAGGTAPLGRYHRVEPHQNITVGSNTVTDLIASVVQWARKNAR